MSDFVQGSLRYNGEPSREVARLRALEKEREEERVDWFAAQQRKLNKAVDIDYPIPAIRGWRFKDGCMTSLSFQHKWESPVEREHTNITRRGYTGFWAVKPNEKALRIVELYYPDIVGIVELSGRVVEHEHGWRGEVCTIVELFTDVPHVIPFAKKLERMYQCDLNFDLSVPQLHQAMRRLKQ